VRADLFEQSPGVLLNEREVAEAIHVSVKTLQHWRQHGQGPQFLRLGRHIRYRVGDVIAWLERSRG
jgi:predicted DNA-binding transcriptional regulator AlpA